MFYEKLNYYYKNNNAKNTIVFLHGWGADLNLFKTIEKYFNNYNILNFDFYGFGKSNFSFGDIDIFEYSKNIYFFIKSIVGDSDVILISHSFGFRIATILSSSTDLNISKIVAVGGAGVKPRFNLKIFLKKIYYKVFLKKRKIKDCSEIKLELRNNDGVAYSIKYLSDYYNIGNNMKNFFVNVVNEHLNFLYKDIDIKTYLYWGKKDKETPMYMCEYLRRRIKKSKVKIVNGDHFCFVYDKEKFCNSVLRFLN